MKLLTRVSHGTGGTKSSDSNKVSLLILERGIVARVLQTAGTPHGVGANKNATGRWEVRSYSRRKGIRDLRGGLVSTAPTSINGGTVQP